MLHGAVITIHDWQDWQATDEIPAGCTVYDDGIEIDGDDVCYTDVSRCARCGAFSLSDQGGDYIAVIGDTTACQHPLPTVEAEGTTWIVYPHPTCNFGHCVYDGRDANYQGARWHLFQASELSDEVLQVLAAIKG